jgi:hypothetical protein
MKRLAIALAISMVALSMAPAAKADSIGPNCGSCNGGTYTLTYSGAPISSTSTTQTFRITLVIGTAGVAAVLPSAVAIDAAAIKVSSSVSSASLFAAPGGLSKWNLVPGGINSGGCSGAGGGFECADWIASGPGALIGGTLQWTFDVTIASGSLFTGLNAASIKARYVNSSGIKVGSLVSEKITLQKVPEPGTIALLSAGLLGLAALRRRLP